MAKLSFDVEHNGTTYTLKPDPSLVCGWYEVSYINKKGLSCSCMKRFNPRLTIAQKTELFIEELDFDEMERQERNSMYE